MRNNYLFYFFLTFSFCSGNINGQSLSPLTISSAGTFYEDNYSLSFTAGEIVNKTIKIIKH